MYAPLPKPAPTVGEAPVPPLWTWFDVDESEVRAAWDSRPAVFRGGGRDHVGLLTLQDIATLLDRALEFPSLRVVLDGERIMPQPLDAPVPAWEAVEALTRNGTIGLNALELTWEPVAEVCQRIQQTYPLAQVDSNAVYSPPYPQGVPAHEDPMAVLVLQVVGSKHWRYAAERRSRQLTEEVVLRPGDLFLVPRGFFHDVAARTEDSVHLIFQFARTDVWDVLRRGLDRAEAALGTDGWFDEPIRDDDLDELAARLVAHADLPAAAIEHERRFRTTRAGLRPGGPRTGGLRALLTSLEAL
ncbi:MAG: cupin domain-containing protein [Myxococcota bacterium]